MNDKHEEELLSSLIGDIYDTTLDRSRWPATLKKIAASVGRGDVYFEDGASIRLTETSILKF